MYAQLNFSNNRFKKVDLIGGVDVGIVPLLIDKHPTEFVNLTDRTDIDDLNTVDSYYDAENDVFLRESEIPLPASTHTEPYQPTNAEVAQTISDLQADLIINGVIE